MIKEIRTKSKDVYSILNKLQSSSIDVNLVDKKILNRIKNHVKIDKDRVYLPNKIKIYKNL